MAQKDKLESFIESLFVTKKGLSKNEILQKAQDADFAADVVVFFKELPDKGYDENSLIESLNSVIKKKGRSQAIGGLLKEKARTW